MPARALPFWLAAVLALLSLPAYGQSEPFRANVNAQVAAARQVAPDLGVHVVELLSGKAVYSYNPETRRILASNTKLVTSAAALDRLGPGYFFETEVLVRGQVAGGVLAGDLAIVGGGDPNLSGRQYQGDSFGAFREWAAALQRIGVGRIEGVRPQCLFPGHVLSRVKVCSVLKAARHRCVVRGQGINPLHRSVGATGDDRAGVKEIAPHVGPIT